MDNITIDVSNPDLYTDVFWKIQACKNRFVVNYGGSGSSKSVSQHQNELINLLSNDYDTLFIRKHAADIRDSCYKLLQNIASDWGVNQLLTYRFSNAVREIENNQTGQRILFRGIDDPEKVKSIVGIKRIIIEEASELTFEDFLELNRRARGFKDIQIIFLLNPISENHWIKRKLIDGDAFAGRVDVIVSTYKDNKFLTDDDRAELEALKDIDENHYRIYALGEWGIDNKNGKFAYSFDSKKHIVSDIAWTPEQYTYLSFDFNVNPICCTVIQDFDDIISVVECIKLSDSNIYALCDRIRSTYPGGLFIVTGDATGRSRSAMVKDDLNYYLIIKAELGISDAQFKVPSVNPRIEENRVLVNAALNTKAIEISENKAEALIYDLRYCEVDEQNKLVKDRSAKNREADALDTFRYYLNAFHRNILKNRTFVK